LTQLLITLPHPSLEQKISFVGFYFVGFWRKLAHQLSCIGIREALMLAEPDAVFGNHLDACLKQSLNLSAAVYALREAQRIIYEHKMRT
jgi:hypothetical protein